MNSRALIEQTKCRFREFRREPSAMFWVMFMPVMWMVILGFAFDGELSKRYGVAYDQLTAPGDDMLGVLESLEQHEEIVLRQGGEVDILRWFRRGEVLLVVSQSNGKIVYGYDTSNPEAKHAVSVVNEIAQEALGRKDVAPVLHAPPPVTAPSYVEFLIPGLLGLSIMTSSLFGVGMTIVANRRENLLKRFLCTPMPPSYYIVSHIFGRLLVLAFEVVIVLFAGWLIFSFLVSGAIGTFLFISALGAAAFTAIALLCAARTKSLPMVSAVTNLISLPMMLLSGVFFAKTNFPDHVVPFLNLLPLTALVDGLRKVSLEGAQLVDLSSEILTLSIFTVVAAILARARFRWH